jgi:hypothetical protein
VALGAKPGANDASWLRGREAEDLGEAAEAVIEVGAGAGDELDGDVVGARLVMFLEALRDDRAVPSKMNTKWLSRRRADPGLAGSASSEMKTGWNTHAVHERSRPVPTDPARSWMTWANDSAEQTSCTVAWLAPVFRTSDSASDNDLSFRPTQPDDIGCLFLSAYCHSHDDLRYSEREDSADR